MNEKRKNADTYLRRYHRICENEQIIKEQMFAIDRLMGASRISTLTTVPTRSGSSRYEDFLVEQISRKDELKVRLAVISGQKAVFAHIMESLPKREREVIERFYLCDSSRGAADALMERLGFEKSHIYRIKDRALDMIAERLDDFGEDDILSLGIKKAHQKA